MAVWQSTAVSASAVVGYRRGSERSGIVEAHSMGNSPYRPGASDASGRDERGFIPKRAAKRKNFAAPNFLFFLSIPGG